MNTIFTLTPDERASVEQRLDSDYIDELAALAWEELEDRDLVEISYMPGNATWYALLLADLRPGDVVALTSGGGTGTSAIPAGSVYGDADTIIVWAQAGTMVAFEWSTLEGAADNIAEALGGTAADQVAISALLRRLA